MWNQEMEFLYLFLVDIFLYVNFALIISPKKPFQNAQVVENQFSSIPKVLFKPDPVVHQCTMHCNIVFDTFKKIRIFLIIDGNWILGVDGNCCRPKIQLCSSFIIWSNKMVQFLRMRNSWLTMIDHAWLARITFQDRKKSRNFVMHSDRLV